MARIERRKSVVAEVGGVKVGGTHLIVVQSMTNTDTADVAATVRQVAALARTGSELVRITVNTEAGAAWTAARVNSGYLLIVSPYGFPLRSLLIIPPPAGLAFIRNFK